MCVRLLTAVHFTRKLSSTFFLGKRFYLLLVVNTCGHTQQTKFAFYFFDLKVEASGERAGLAGGEILEELGIGEIYTESVF